MKRPWERQRPCTAQAMWGGELGVIVFNGSKRLIYVKACATDGGIVWEGLAAMALLEAVSLESAN